MTMLALSRRLIQADARLRQGLWNPPSRDNGKSRPMHTLEGQTVGIVGFGHIGKQVAIITKAFGMKTIAIKRTPDLALAQECGLEFLGGMDDLPEILSRSDFLVLAAPLTSATSDSIGESELARLKATAYVINVSRGPIVQEEALYRVLSEQRIAGAALDVWYEYPKDNTPTLPAHLPFHLLDNVILTPHYSGATEETRIGRLADMTFNLQSWLEHKPLHNVVSSRETNPP
jgi:phosphoglycerate dehydrogenase-like enzyme